MPIQVGKAVIEDDEIFAEMQYQDNASSLKEACFLAAQALVIRQLLLDEAAKQNIVATDEESAISTLIEQAVSVPATDEDICRRYYQNNQARFKDKKTGKTLDYEQVVGPIKEYLSTQSLMNGISEYIQVLTADTKIKGFDFKNPEAMEINMQTNPFAIKTEFITVGDGKIATDQEGYIQDTNEWSEEFAIELAKKEEIELTSEHWDVINFIRDYYEEHSVQAQVRDMIKHFRKKWGSEVGNNHHLHDLFPKGGPQKQGNRLAGIRRTKGEH